MREYLFFYFLFSSLVFGEGNSGNTSLILPFSRTVSSGEMEEITHGTFYFDGIRKISLLKVEKPNTQIFFFDEKSYTIYYPNEGKAFKFESKENMPMPFLEAIRSVTNPYLGLKTAGFSLVSSKIEKEIMYTFWQPLKKIKKTHGIAVLGQRISDGCVVSFENKTPKGLTLSKVSYRNHHSFESWKIPMEITSYTRFSSGDFQKEGIIFQKTELGKELPEWVASFTFPDEIQVQVFK